MKDGSVYRTFDVLGAFDTLPFGINDVGQIVGNVRVGATEYQAFVGDGSTFTILNVPGSIERWAYGIDDTGRIVGYFDDAQHRRH